MGRKLIPPKEKRESPKYTHEELDAAIKQFRKEGGLIKKLPDEKVPGKQIGSKSKRYLSQRDAEVYSTG